MRYVFVETQNVQRFRSALAIVSDIERGQPGLAVVWGRAGRGKTDCARQYTVDTAAVYLRVMEDWTPRAMLARLCYELNGDEPRSVDGCKRLAIEMLRADRRPVLVDEADRLRIGQIEHFRDIHDETGAPVILIGEEHLFPAINARRRLWSRVTQTVEFGPIEAEDIMIFCMRSASLKCEPEAAKALESRAGGDFRLVWRDVMRLERMARASAETVITPAMMNKLPPHLNGGRKVAAGRPK
jgi:DNA transposition AAA+ family ATPase